MMLNMERDDLPEVDVTEDEFDQMFAEGEPAEVVLSSRELVAWADLYAVGTATATRGGSVEVRTVSAYAFPAVTVFDARHAAALASR